MATSVGADIESICGKCGDVWHVVVAMIGDKVVKVECKQCGRQHRHKPPGGTTVRVSKRGKVSASKRAPKKAQGQSQSSEPLIPFNPKRPPRSYAITESFQVGDRIAHRKFGEGVVELIVGPGKVQVFFPSGRRVMAHER